MGCCQSRSAAAIYAEGQRGEELGGALLGKTDEEGSHDGSGEGQVAGGGPSSHLAKQRSDRDELEELKWVKGEPIGACCAASLKLPFLHPPLNFRNCRLRRQRAGLPVPEPGEWAADGSERGSLRSL